MHAQESRADVVSRHSQPLPALPTGHARSPFGHRYADEEKYMESASCSSTATSPSESCDFFDLRGSCDGPSTHPPLGPAT